MSSQEREPIRWVTVQGKHFPIYADDNGNEYIGIGQEKSPSNDSVIKTSQKRMLSLMLNPNILDKEKRAEALGIVKDLPNGTIITFSKDRGELTHWVKMGDDKWFPSFDSGKAYKNGNVVTDMKNSNDAHITNDAKKVPNNADEHWEAIKDVWRKVKKEK